MYKLTFYDQCSLGIVDWPVSYFVDDLEKFEEKWIPLVQDKEPERLKRYERSKHGEIVSDFYGDCEEMNIVQVDKEACVLEEKLFTFDNLDIDLVNSYQWESKHHINTLRYTIRKIRFARRYFLIGQYSIEGIYRYHEIPDRWTGEIYHYMQEHVFGNPVCEVKLRKLYGFDRPRPESERIISNRTENYAEDTIRSFVWHIIGECDATTAITMLTDEELQKLLVDIPGEAG